MPTIRQRDTPDGWPVAKLETRQAGYPQCWLSGNPRRRKAGWPGLPIPGKADSQLSGYPPDRRSAMARTRTTAKPESQQAASAVKLSLTLPADLARRFGVHAEMLGVSKSDLFADLVRTGCRRYIVHDHGGREQGGEGVAEAG
jgi:hypothetical protein